MAESLEKYIENIEKRIRALESAMLKGSASIQARQSSLQNTNTSRRVNINKNSYIDANGRAVFDTLELTGLTEQESAVYILSIDNGIINFIPLSAVSGASLPIYSGDPEENGTWKIHADDGNFHVQCRINGQYYDQILQTPSNEGDL